MQGKKNNINPEEVENLASRFWTQKEIGAFFKVHEDTIRDNFQEQLKRGQETGRSILRDLQLKIARGGNVTMLIWLGKQYLNQREPKNEEGNMDIKDFVKVIKEAANS
jgi:hypothetical protein